MVGGLQVEHVMGSGREGSLKMEMVIGSRQV